MKKLILILTVLSLTGCAGGFKSYYALQDECESGVVQSCRDLRSRDRVTGTMSAGLDGYNKQQLINAATQQQQTSPNADVVQQLQRMQQHQDLMNLMNTGHY